MTAGHIEELYSDYLDGTLAAAESERVEEHLRSCGQCAAELAALRELTADLRELPQLPLPASFNVGVRERLRLTHPIPLFSWRNPTFSGAIAALLLLGVFIALQHQPAPHMAQLSPVAKGSAISPQAGNNSGINSILNMPDMHPDELPPIATSKANIMRILRTNYHYKGDGSVISANIYAGLPPAMPGTDIAALNNEPPPKYTVATSMATLLSDNSNVSLSHPMPADSNMIVSKGSGGWGGGPALLAEYDGVGIPAPTGGDPILGTPIYASPAGNQPGAYGATISSPYSAGTQRLTNGILIAKIQADPAPGNNIMLQFKGVSAGTFDASIIDAAGKARDVNAQKIKLSGAPTQNIILNVAEEDEASTIRFAINSGLKTNNFYLFVPGKNSMNAASTGHAANAKEANMANTLAQLAQDSGMYVLCPADFVEDDSKDTIVPVADINAVKSFATQRRYRIDKTAQFYNVSSIGE